MPCLGLGDRAQYPALIRLAGSTMGTVTPSSYSSRSSAIGTLGFCVGFKILEIFWFRYPVLVFYSLYIRWGLIPRPTGLLDCGEGDSRLCCLAAQSS